MDLDRTDLDLRVVDWVQTISVQGPADPPGTSLRARCSAVDNFHLSLGSGENITQIPIDVRLSQGPLTAGDGRPLERGVGVFNYNLAEGQRVAYVRSEGQRPRSVIACYVGLEPDFYSEVWAQVRSGAFSESSISLALAPVQSSGKPVWQVTNRGNLFVLGASFRFIHSRPQPPRII